MTEHDLSAVHPDILSVAERAGKVGWEYEWNMAGKEPSLRISVPNGRNAVKLTVNKSRAARLLVFEFEEFRMLGDYRAINSPTTGYIEALIKPGDRYSELAFIDDIPGAEAIEDAEQVESEIRHDDKSIDGGDFGERSNRDRYPQYRLIVKDENRPWSIELSPVTDRFRALTSMRVIRSRMPASLKIYGIDALRHDDALTKLESISGAFFFDIDIRYGISFELGQRSVVFPGNVYVPEPLSKPPVLPRLQYPRQALSLYGYGRSADEIPLLQFLAFYQVLEFFFPMHSQREALRALRRTVTDPRFDVNDDADLSRVLRLAAANSRTGFGSEKEQLKATIYGSVNETDMWSFLHADPEFFGRLADKKTIKSIPVIDEGNRGVPVLDQVTARVYALRNRVVHAKADGGDTAVELLLPGSIEAKSMAADVALVKFLAQKAIVAGAVQLG